MQAGFSGAVYLIYANAMMGIPMALGAFDLFKHENRDIQSVFLSLAYATVAAMAIIAPYLILSFGEEVTGENYFSSYYWLLLSFLTVFGIFILIASFAFTIGSDLLKSLEEKVSKDFLSGLLTRRAFDKEANELLSNCECDNKPIGLVICDLDFFKQINDHYGHHTGDAVIAAFGKLVLKIIPDGAVVGRTGGEEFAIILPGSNISSARLFAEGLRTALSLLPVAGIPEEKKVTASFGVSVLRSKEKLASGFKRADEALYEAKKTGRNRVISSNFDAFEYSIFPQNSVA